MAIESRYHRDKSVVFRETFNSELAVRRNGGVLTSVGSLFENGVWIGNTSSYIRYLNSTIKNAKTYRIRFKLREFTTANWRVIQFGNNLGFTHDDFSTGTDTYILFSSEHGNIYLDGELIGSGEQQIQVEIGKWYEVVAIMNNIPLEIAVNVRSGGINSSMGNHNFELLELYDRVLTDTEVALLYNKSLYTKPATFRQGTPSFYSNAQAYGNFGNHPEYEIQSFRFTWFGWLEANTTNQHVFSVNYNASDNTSGFSILKDGNDEIGIVLTGRTQSLKLSNIVNDGINRIIVDLINDDLTINLNGNTQSVDLSIGGTITYHPDGSTLLNAANNNGNPISIGNFYHLRCKLEELDSSGNFVKDLIDLDFNQSGTTIPNIAADAPVGSDGTVIPNGQVTDSWWQQYDGYKEVFNLDLTRGVIPSEDKYGNAIVNNGVVSKKAGKVSSGYFMLSKYLQLNGISSITSGKKWYISAWVKVTGQSQLFEFWFRDTSAKFSIFFKDNLILGNTNPGGAAGSVPIIPKRNEWFSLCVFIQDVESIQSSFYVNGVNAWNNNVEDNIIGEFRIGHPAALYGFNGFTSDFVIGLGHPADPVAFAAREYNANKYKFGL